MADRRPLKRFAAAIAVYCGNCSPFGHSDPCWAFDHPEIRQAGASVSSRRFEFGPGEQAPLELTRVCESVVVGTWSVLDTTVARLISQPNGRVAAAQLIGVAPGTTRLSVSGLTAADPDVVVPSTIEVEIAVAR